MKTYPLYRVTFTDYAADMGEAPAFFTPDRDPTFSDVADGIVALFEYLFEQNRDHLIEILGEYATPEEAENAADAFAGKITRADLEFVEENKLGVRWKVTAPVRFVNIEEITLDADGNEEADTYATTGTTAG